MDLLHNIAVKTELDIDVLKIVLIRMQHLVRWQAQALVAMVLDVSANEFKFGLVRRDGVFQIILLKLLARVFEEAEDSFHA